MQLVLTGTWRLCLASASLQRHDVVWALIWPWLDVMCLLTVLTGQVICSWRKPQWRRPFSYNDPYVFREISGKRSCFDWTFSGNKATERTPTRLPTTMSTTPPKPSTTTTAPEPATEATSNSVYEALFKIMSKLGIKWFGKKMCSTDSVIMTCS